MRGVERITARAWWTAAVALAAWVGIAIGNAGGAEPVSSVPAAVAPQRGDDPLAAWRAGFDVRPVSAAPGRHTIHSYYVANPESPDGRFVLYYATTAADGGVGDLCVLERATGVERVVARGVQVEDAHRAACQQWLSGGKRIAFHEVVDGRWRVVIVDAATLDRTIVAWDHQLGFGQPTADLLTLYGCHWNPGPHRDLELWDAATGQTRTVVRIEEVEARLREWLGREFSGAATSIFFPVLSPDLQRVFFKLAAGRGGDEYRSKAASHRQGLLVYDLRGGRLAWTYPKWGHPAWLPDSRRILELGYLVHDSETGAVERLTGLPVLGGMHPSASPDGRLLVTDGAATPLGGSANEYAILVADLRGGAWVELARSDQARGVASWRRNHPHPVFSADGRRVYFNATRDDRTQLMVAEPRSVP